MQISSLRLMVVEFASQSGKYSRGPGNDDVRTSADESYLCLIRDHQMRTAKYDLPYTSILTSEATHEQLCAFCQVFCYYYYIQNCTFISPSLIFQQILRQVVCFHFGYEGTLLCEDQVCPQKDWL